PLRTSPAGVVRFQTHNICRHHRGFREKARGDGSDRGSTLSAGVLRTAGRASRQSRAPCIGERKDQAGRSLSKVHTASGEFTVTILDELARLGSATIYEANDRQGLVDIDLIQLVPGSRAAWPARTVHCGQDDNLMVHAAMAEVRMGELLVITS